MRVMGWTMAALLAASLAHAAQAQEQESADMALLTAPYQAADGQTQEFKQLIYDAIAAHPSVRSAFARQGQASADRDAAKSALRPQLSVEMQGRASLASDFGTDFDNLVNRSQSQDDARASLVARQLLFDGGAASGRLKAAGFTEEEASANAEADITDFTLSAIGAYYDVVRYRMVQDLMAGNVERHQTLLDDIRSRLRQGVAGARDEARGEARLADARARLVGAKRKLDEARSRYVSIFDQPPVFAVLPALPFAGTPDREDMEDRALDGSPLLEAALHRNEAKAAELHSAKAERYLPSISVELRGTRYNIGEGGQDYDVSAILAVNYALYSGGLKSARENRALQQLRETQYDLDATRRDIIKRVRTAYQTYTSMTDELALLKTAAAANARSRDIFLEQYSVAGGSVLDVFQAEDDYVAAAQGYINGLADHALAAYALYAETGQLLPAFNFYLTEDGPDDPGGE